MHKKRKQTLQKCIINAQFKTKMYFVLPATLLMMSQGILGLILSQVFQLFSFLRTAMLVTAKMISKIKTVASTEFSSTSIYSILPILA
jgi:hypothetical protein